MTSIYLLRFLAPGCHLQGVFQIRGKQSQHVNLGTASPLLECLKYYNYKIHEFDKRTFTAL